MKIVNVMVSVVILATAGSVFARELTSSHINLGGGTVAPTQVLKVPFDKLVPNVAYNVTCSVKDQNNEQNKLVMVFSTEYVSGVLGDFILNGQKLGSACGSVQAELPQVDNTFEATSMYNFAKYLNFINTDQQDSVVVSCAADAAK